MCTCDLILIYGNISNAKVPVIFLAESTQNFSFYDDFIDPSAQLVGEIWWKLPHKANILGSSWSLWTSYVGPLTEHE